MTRARLDPSSAYVRHPLEPHRLTVRRTPTEDAIVLCHFGVPRLDAQAWTLTIDGLVRRPLRLTLGELMRRPSADVASVHECCGSPLKPETPTRRVCNVVWRGVRLADLLADCKPLDAARFVWSSGADYGVFQDVKCEAYIKDLPRERVAEDVLVAYAMNGKMLKPEHGFPARLVVPGFYGTNSVKWLTRMSLAEKRATGPFATRWYVDAVKDETGRPTGERRPVWTIAPECLIVAPAPDRHVPVGKATEIWGWAWADGGASAVEVSSDGGASWAEANLEPPAGRQWQRFGLSWQPQQRGAHELRARARSMGGEVQPLSGARNEVHRVSVQVA